MNAELDLQIVKINVRVSNVYFSIYIWVTNLHRKFKGICFLLDNVANLVIQWKFTANYGYLWLSSQVEYCAIKSFKVSISYKVCCWASDSRGSNWQI